jgi:hypothetical protein
MVAEEHGMSNTDPEKFVTVNVTREVARRLHVCTDTVEFYLAPEDYDKLTALARAAGLPLSQYVSEMVEDLLQIGAQRAQHASH